MEGNIIVVDKRMKDSIYKNGKSAVKKSHVSTGSQCVSPKIRPANPIDLQRYRRTRIPDMSTPPTSVPVPVGVLIPTESRWWSYLYPCGTGS